MIRLALWLAQHYIVQAVVAYWQWLAVAFVVGSLAWAALR